MRKLLLASTALVGAFTLVDRADAQQLTTDSPFTVRIDGFMNFRGGIVGETNQTGVSAGGGNAVRANAAKVVGRGDNFKTDTEIHITATGKADNGLVYGMYVEIEADPALNVLTTSTVNNNGGSTGTSTATATGTSSNNYIDEANIFLQGSWGRIEMGDQDGASDQLFFGAPYDYGPAYGQGSGADGDILFRWANNVGNTVASSNINATPSYSWNVKALDSNDSTKITYLSPVIAGFRAGVSFAPGGEQNGFLNAMGTGTGGRGSATITSLTSGSTAFSGVPTTSLAGTSSALPATGRPGLANAYGAYADYQHWWEMGAQWRGTVGDVGLGVQAGYVHADAKKSLFNPQANVTNSTGQGAFTGYKFVDINSWHVGGQVSWMGLTVGGSYSNSGRSTYLSGPFLRKGPDTWAAVAGIQYAIGPWVVGYNYSYTETAGSPSPLAGRSRDSVDWHSVGAKYILAPGLFLFTEYAHYVVRDQSVVVNTGNAGIIGTGIRF